MKSRIMACVVMVLVAAAFWTPTAKADSITWNWSYTDGGLNTGSGTFITGTIGNPFTVTGVSGKANGLAITGLSLYASADNLLYDPTVAYPNFVDVLGISFTTVGGREFNLFNYLNQYGLADSLLNPAGVFNGDFGAPDPGIYAVKMNVTRSVPEPTTIILLGFGLVGLGLVARKKQRQAA